MHLAGLAPRPQMAETQAAMYPGQVVDQGNSVLGRNRAAHPGQMDPLQAGQVQASLRSSLSRWWEQVVCGGM